ncbi:MAG: acyl-CoA dehydrogenase [Deltaproteobacteria bacterium]|nr:MAG: acyl-CoA dehydrogenase [Deltaproteobacteria bacterium]
MYASNDKELNLLDKSSLEFAKKELAPGREENDHFPFGPFFGHVVDKAFELDFFHIFLPEDLGGVGHGIRALCIVLNNICRKDSSLGGIMFTNAFAQSLMLEAGATEVLKQISDKAGSAGEFLIACPVLSDPARSPMGLSADRDGENYKLSGKINYVVLGGMAGHALLPASMPGEEGYSWFLVDLSDPAVVKSDVVFSHGMHACPAVDIELKGVLADLVGSAGEGNLYFRKAASVMQVAAAAMAAGVMKGSLEEALGYCRQRRQGGRMIKDWSEQQMLLSNMAVQTEVAQMLVSRACMAIAAKDKDWETRAGAAALHVVSSAADVVSDGIQSMGGVGYMKDFGQEKRFRDTGHIQALLGFLPLKKLDFIRKLL